MPSPRPIACVLATAFVLCCSLKAEAQYQTTRSTNPYSSTLAEVNATRSRIEREGNRLKEVQKRAASMTEDLLAEINSYKQRAAAHKRFGETQFSYRNGVHRRAHERWLRERDQLERDRKLLKLKTERLQASLKGIESDVKRWQDEVTRFNDRLSSLRKPAPSRGTATLTFDELAPKRR